MEKLKFLNHQSKQITFLMLGHITKLFDFPVIISENYAKINHSKRFSLKVSIPFINSMFLSPHLEAGLNTC